MMNINISEISPFEALKKDAGHLHSVIKRALKRISGKLAKQQEELSEAEQSTHYSEIADSLLAHPEKIRKGMTSWLLLNTHTQQEEQITLDPALSVFENAQSYYKKARKGKRGVSIIREKLSLARSEESALKKLMQELETLDRDPPLPLPDFEAGLSVVKAGLEERGILPRQGPARKKAPEETVPYRHFTLDGYDIFVGKNDAQNDELTTRFAKPWDIWMHVAACAGSHVVLRREKNAPWPPKDILVKTASLSVWFSKAKHTSYSDVHFTEARFVHKRRHSPPGEVAMDRFKTLRVPPKSPQDFFGGDFDK